MILRITLKHHLKNAATKIKITIDKKALSIIKRVSL